MAALIFHSKCCCTVLGSRHALRAVQDWGLDKELFTLQLLGCPLTCHLPSTLPWQPGHRLAELLNLRPRLARPPPGATHLWKWCQRCPSAGCSCVSACAGGCRCHSSGRSPRGWWAACKSRRRSGWVPGAAAAKDRRALSIHQGTKPR